MFKWFRRAEAPSAPAPAPASRHPPAAARPLPAAPAAPLPEVVAEGNTQADWSAWEDSMAALDSQMQGLMPTNRVYVRDTRPSQLDELDPFAGVRRKRDV
jgi:hypothetical protein